MEDNFDKSIQNNDFSFIKKNISSFNSNKIFYGLWYCVCFDNIKMFKFILEQDFLFNDKLNTLFLEIGQVSKIKFIKILLENDKFDPSWNKNYAIIDLLKKIQSNKIPKELFEIRLMLFLDPRVNKTLINNSPRLFSHLNEFIMKRKLQSFK